MQFLQFNIANMGDSNVTNYQKAVQGTGKNAIFNTLGGLSRASAAHYAPMPRLKRAGTLAPSGIAHYQH